MSELVVVAFDNATEADALMDKLAKLEKQHLVSLDDAAVVVRKADGKVKVKQAQSLVGAGAVGGAFWGMLIGLLFLAPWLGMAIGALSGALGYHDLNARAIPFGFVFDLDERSDDWTVTLSHEALEMMLDPLASALVPGPNPKDGNLALHTYEVCDAVERTDYDIDGVRVSNFVTPSFFTVGDEPATRNDFLGIGVESFRALPGSHLAYFRLDTNRWETHVEANLPRNARAAARFDEKNLPEPKTPRDEVAIQGVLEAYKNGKPPAPGCRGLPDLRAVSRNGKYMSSLPDGSGAGRGGNGAQPHSDVAEREASRTTT